MTTLPIETDALADLAKQINAEHEAAEAAYQDALRRAMACGDLLIEAKRKLGHGTWLPWLAENCPAVSGRAARLCMQLARARPDIEDKLADVANLTIRGAMILVRREQQERKRAAYREEMAEARRRRANEPTAAEYMRAPALCARSASDSLAGPRLPFIGWEELHPEPPPTEEMMREDSAQALVDQMLNEAAFLDPRPTFDDLLEAMRRARSPYEEWLAGLPPRRRFNVFEVWSDSIDEAMREAAE